MSSSGSLGQLLGPIQKEIDLFEQRLDEMLQADVEMVHDVARYMATLKGKRLRPALTVLCARATGHWDDRVIDAGVSVEMVHVVTLIHDDVIDQADTRRGKPSVNAKCGDRRPAHSDHKRQHQRNSTAQRRTVTKPKFPTARHQSNSTKNHDTPASIAANRFDRSTNHK